MQQIKKEDQPKLYALIALSVAVFGYFIYSYAFASNTPAPGNKPAAGASPAAPAGGAPAADAAPAGGAPVANNAAAAPQDQTFQPEKVRPTVGGRDPFQPIGVASAATPQAPPPPTPAAPMAPRLPQPSAVPAVAAAPKKLPKSLQELLYSGDATPNGKAPVRPVDPGPPPVPELVVTGVVLGDPTSGNARNVAILRSPNGEERRFVSAGDYVGNGYTVVAVYADGIELKDKAGNRRVTIKLGQSGDKTRAK